MYTSPLHPNQIIIFQHTSADRNLNTELICLHHAGEHSETVNEHMSSKDSAQQLLTLVEKTSHTLQTDLSFSFFFQMRFSESAGEIM